MTQQVQNVGDQDRSMPSTVQDAAHIPALAHTEAARMAASELDRFLALLGQLSEEDWAKPTACARWDVRQVVAHMAGSAASIISLAEFRRQGSGRVQRPYRRAGFSKLDALNQIQVDDRADASPDELIAEMQQFGPRSVARRERLPAALRAVRLPLGLSFPLGRVWVPIGYMMDTILLRDAWMHRLDICRATGREMVTTPEHDGRFTALVVRELASTIAAGLDGASLTYELSGPAGGAWRIGCELATPAASIRMDALDFHLLASGRLSPVAARELVDIRGDEELGNRVRELTSVPY